MDAVKFHNEAKRICKYYKHCAGCIADVNAACAFDLVAAPIGTEEVVALVEQWAKEHPRKTRQSEFLKQWPNAKIGNEGTVAIDPCIFDTTVRKERCIATSCAQCRREFWLKEVE